MRAFGRFLGRLLAVLGLVAVTIWLFGPYEKIDLDASFDSQKFDNGVQVYFESVESQFSGITPGTEKRVIWQPGFEEQRTPVSVLYVHGFSATSQEIRPVPDRIADALGANLVYTRLQGHGQGGAELAAASPSVWMMDVAEGLAAARAVGEKVVVISTSTGGTLVAAAALNPELSESVAAMIFVSPNFGVNDPLAFLMTWPAARYWVPWVMPDDYVSSAKDPQILKYWTTSYPWVATVPMGALVKMVAALDFSAATTPALFWFSMGDQVVRPEATRLVAEAWGGPVTINVVSVGPGDDPSSHVIAGDIRSPGQTEPAVTGMLAWLAALGVE
jgi:alpha-beta hydrolase superfamily lysophospholipase